MFNWFKKQTTPANTITKCPYCQAELDKIPVRKVQCKSCKKPIFVRTHYLTKEKLILTEKAATDFDLEREQYYTDKSLLDGLKKNLDIDSKFLDKLTAKTTETLFKKFGHPPSLGDVAWSVANQMTLEAMKNKQLHLASSIQFQMALYLHYSSKNCNPILENSLELTLKEAQLNGYKQVSILTGQQSCDYCQLQKDKLFSIEEALSKKLLPCQDCTFKLNPKAPTGWCRCLYMPKL
ncbi:hypothetical protein IT411_01680 [Candidatus Peregrinibacteria bacterium]|nr:hypothetical protein [Candidatus Peregrinibacteria bacterium]